jgi:hypothetical protein
MSKEDMRSMVRIAQSQALDQWIWAWEEALHLERRISSCFLSLGFIRSQKSHICTDHFVDSSIFYHCNLLLPGQLLNYSPV